MSTVSNRASNSKPPSYKRCSGLCKRRRKIVYFNKDRSCSDGFDAVCRDCRSQYRKSLPTKPESPERHNLRIERQQKRRNTLATKICAECGNPYSDRNGSGKLCSDCKIARRKQFRPQTFLTCEHCGQEFGPVDHLKVKYCSYECKKAAQVGKPTAARGKKYPSKQRARTVTCASCGTQFRAIHETRKKPQIYCSHACYLRERRVSHFEIRVMDLIESAGISLDRQVRRGKWSFDAAISNTVILIEADGAYWHSPIHVQERDGRKNQWCKDNGFILIRVPELAFYRNPVEAIMPVIQRWEKETNQQAQLLERVEVPAHA